MSDIDLNELKETETMVVNPTSIRERIDEALEQLANLSTAKRSRADIIADLARDLSEYYGYIQELSEFLLDLFSPSECVEYMDASDRPRPLVIRTNTIKTTRKDLMELLTKRGAALEAIEWSKVAIKVTESSVPIGATPEYLAGYYMLQSAASLNPVMALAPLPGEKVLDMSAAPGGKTSYIAQLMKNSGSIIANDLKPQRQKATIANLHRLGVKNAIVCSYDGRKINQIFKGFDRVLLDAPCSGLGVISRDQSVKLQRTVKDIQRIAHLQKELLRAAVDCVDPKSPTGGIIVYSTCSISCEENEQVVDYILSKRYVRLIDTGLEVGKPGFTRHMEKRFHPSLALTRRFYPHVHNMDGFYVAKFKKYANGVRGEEEDKNKNEEDDEGEDSVTEDEDDEEEVGSEEQSESDEEEEEEVKPKTDTKQKQSKTEKPVAEVKQSTKVVPVAPPVAEKSAPKVTVKPETKAPATEKKTDKAPTVAPVVKETHKASVETARAKEEVESKKSAAAAPAAASAAPSKVISVSKTIEKVVEDSESDEEEQENGDDNDGDDDIEDNEPMYYPPSRPKKRSIKALRAAFAKKTKK